MPGADDRHVGVATSPAPVPQAASVRLGQRVLGPGAALGRRQPAARAVIAPHWTQFDGVIFTSTVPSPASSPTS